MALRTEFERTGAAVDVSFRSILPSSALTDRATHDLHPYPARLLLNIPAFFLSTTLSEPGDMILDPFCGSGTTLLEALLAGRNATGADANPFARLLTRVKTTAIEHVQLESASKSLLRKEDRIPRGDYPEVINLEYWFYPHIRQQLLCLLERIREIKDPKVRQFFLVALSACIREASLADPRLSVPVRLKVDQYPSGHHLQEKTNRHLRSLRARSVFRMFESRIHRNILLLDDFTDWPKRGRMASVAADVRDLSHLGSESIDLVLTSPPYLGAQKYIRASSLSLTWLELCKSRELRTLEDGIIGREHYRKKTYTRPIQSGIQKADDLISEVRVENPLRAHIAATYLIEMQVAFAEMARVLKPGRFAVVIAGASSLCGRKFPTPEFVITMAEAIDLKLRLHLIDTIRSRALMTKRHRSAGKIDTESILLLQKAE